MSRMYDGLDDAVGADSDADATAEARSPRALLAAEINAPQADQLGSGGAGSAAIGAAELT